MKQRQGKGGGRNMWASECGRERNTERHRSGRDMRKRDRKG